MNEDLQKVKCAEMDREDSNDIAVAQSGKVEISNDQEEMKNKGNSNKIESEEEENSLGLVEEK